MTALVVDASVWVAAADPVDPFSTHSRAFLAAAAARGQPLAVPSLARIELACALARRLQDTHAARRLSDGMVRSPLVREHALDAALVDVAVTSGTAARLRAADAVYLALAEKLRARVVTWDAELIRRGNAMTPEAWLARHPAIPEE